LSKSKENRELTIIDELNVTEKLVSRDEVRLIKSCLAELMIEVLKMVEEDKS
jgi:spore coat protein CotF